MMRDAGSVRRSGDQKLIRSERDKRKGGKDIINMDKISDNFKSGLDRLKKV